jgi:hypothetical protein
VSKILYYDYVKLFLVDYDGSKLEFEIEEIEKYMWLDIKSISESDLDISEMTKYWIDNIDWHKV